MITFTTPQMRVIGVMLEKEVTTPEHYPLSLNALTNACNQKSNRDPVMSLSEVEVQSIVDELIELKQLMVDVGASGRVNKYKHRFCNTQFGSLQFTDQQKAILCVLFLRGPQTPGELRTRTQRLAEFTNVNEVENTLEQLQNLDRAQLVKKLAREPGKRESRYCHLFFHDAEEALVHESDEAVESAVARVNAPVAEGATKSVSALELRVQTLEQQVDELKAQLIQLSALIES